MGKVMFMRKGDMHKMPTGLPSGYTILEYIESTGTQYIDTEYKPNKDTHVLCEVEYKISSATTFLFGGRTSSTANMFSFLQYQSSYRYDYNTTNMSFGTGVSYTEKFKIDANKNTIILSDNETKSATYASFTAPVSMYIFANNNNGTVQGLCTAKVYYFKIYDNEVLVRDFIPCISNTGETGLYDLVGKKFYSNAGTDVFYSNLEHPPVVDVGTVWLYTSNNSFTVPITGKYQVEMHGGGGGGGGAGNKTTGSYVLASGYGGGGSGQLYTLQLTKGDSYAIVVGVGGQAGIASKIYTEWEDANSYSSSTRTAATAGGTGGTTSFGSYSVKGGNGVVQAQVTLRQS
jgi:hypothetical protein